MLQTRETAKTSAAIEVLTLATYPVNSYGSSKGALSFAQDCTESCAKLCKASNYCTLEVLSVPCSFLWQSIFDFTPYRRCLTVDPPETRNRQKKQRFSSVTAFIIMISFCKAKTTGHTKFSHAESMHVVS